MMTKVRLQVQVWKKVPNYFQTLPKIAVICVVGVKQKEKYIFTIFYTTNGSFIIILFNLLVDFSFENLIYK